MHSSLSARVVAQAVRRCFETARGSVSAFLRALLLALWLGEGAAAAAEAQAPDGPFEFSLSPGGFDERCLRIEAGGAIEYEFSAAAPVDFNIHFHRGKEVFFPVKASATRAAVARRFRAEGSDDYCLMWENKGATPVRVSGRLQRLR